MAFFCISCKSAIDAKFKACPFCGEPITDFLRRYLENPIDGKYQILSRLGIGGMGEVYKVLHIHLKTIRVIKMMRPNMLAEAEAHERFIREARLATRIHHPNVASLYDFSALPDGSYYMVWEFIEGTTLADLFRARGSLSPRYTASISMQALRGLESIHRAGVVHRDISPENLMVTRDDEGEERVKIIDLGIAKQWGDTTEDKTKTGIFVGKWKYCSPEHLGMLGDGERIDGRADLYSFGIVMYEALSGLPPFLADTPHGYLISHGKERPKALGLPEPELESIIFRALEKNRADRFESARAMADALRDVLPTLSDTPVGIVMGAAKDDITVERMTPTAFADTTRTTRIASSPVTAGVAESADATTIQDATPSRQDDVLTVRIDSASEEVTVGSGALAGEDATVRGRRSASPDDPDAAPTMVVSAFTESATPTVVDRPWASHAISRNAALGLAALVVVAVALLWSRGSRNDLQTTPQQASVVQPVTAVAAKLGVHAFPWGEIVEIKDLSTNKILVLEQRDPMTPTAVSLPPGRYEITLSNPQFDKQQRIVDLAAGEHEQLAVEFTPASSLPRFEGARP